VDIQKIDAFQVFDSRGNPTLEAEVILYNNVRGIAIVPSGASKGKFEALELRDGDPARFNGQSVYNAISNIKNIISPALNNKNVEKQAYLDKMMADLDGTRDKSRLGANAIVGVSMAIARAAANNRRQPLYKYLRQGKGTLLPLPEIQIIGGGAHSSGRIDIQDFMIICTGAGSYQQCLEMTYNVYRQCREVLKKRGNLAGVADEGGFWPEFDSNEEVFETILESIEMAGYRAGHDIHLSLDIAASEFFSDGKYHLKLEGRSFHPNEFYDLIAAWCNNYPVISIEDPFAETDITNWKKLQATFGDKIQIIGDDLFTTDVERVLEGKKEELANSVLIKLNQIGTVTETIECIKQTQAFGWRPVISARSGETEDPFIAHLAVATDAGQLKVGSFSRSERMVKWNEILRIERDLGGNARYIGGKILTK